MFNETCVPVCSSGEYRDGNGDCQTCPSTQSGKNTEYICLTCGGHWTGSSKKCKNNACDPGYFYNSSADCVSCSSDTSTLATVLECNSCNTGDTIQRKIYQTDAGTKCAVNVCLPKDDVPRYHDNAGTCQSCNTERTVVSIEDCAACTKAGIPRYVDTADSRCKSCPANIASASSAEQCEQCFGGVFENGVCSLEEEGPCPANETPYISYRGGSYTETSCCPEGSVVHEGEGANGADMCCATGESVYCLARDGNGNCWTGSVMCCPVGSTVYEGAGYNNADLCCETGYEAWGGSCIEACPTGQVRNQISGVCETP